MAAETPFNDAAAKAADKPEPEALWQCARSGQDKARIVALLKEEPEALRRSVRFSEDFLGGDQGLHIACRYGQPEVVALLLSCGAGLEDLNKRYNSSPLFAATQASQLAVLDLLLEKGANIETRDNKSRTPLWYAASEGRGPTLDCLLRHGADVEAEGPGKVTPLVAALQESKFGAALALVTHGANLAACDGTGASAFALARSAAETSSDCRGVYRLMVEKENEKAAAAAAALREEIDSAAHSGVDMSGKLNRPLRLAFRKPSS